MTFIGKTVTGLSGLSAAVLVWLGLAGSALADGGPKNWQMGFRPPASPTAEKIHWFNDVILLPTIVAIVVFVMGLYVLPR